MLGSHASKSNVKFNGQIIEEKAVTSDQSKPLGEQHAKDLEPQELSKRELQIVELVSAGMTNQEISKELDISKRTVDNHVSNVLNKTATGNRVALVRWALQSGKVCIDELNCCRLPDA